MEKFKDILLQRCPRCGEGAVFSGIIRMNDQCPVCGLEFTREPGYYTGAMYVSYILGTIIIMPVWAVLFFTWQPVLVTIFVPIIILVVLTPILFRYSRVLWMYFDRAFDPERAARKNEPLPAQPETLAKRRRYRR